MRASALLLLLLALPACDRTGDNKASDGDIDGMSDATDSASDTGDNVGDTDTAEDTSADTDTAEDPGHVLTEGTLHGTVEVVLYDYDAFGNIVELDWADTFGGYPYGKVFLTAFREATDGRILYYGDTVVNSPTGEPDAYEIHYSVDLEETTTLQVYATVDAPYYDGVVSGDEPIISSDLIDISAGPPADPVALTLYIPYDGGDGGDGGSDCDTTTVNGRLTISASYTAGAAAAMIYRSSGGSPAYVAPVTPLPVDGSTGAEADYAMTVCAGESGVNLVGAWDTNLNGLFDPRDLWGSYILDGSTSGNPITLDALPMAGMDILIPFGTFVPGIVPYVSLSGEISSMTGEALAGDVYVVALKRRPSGPIDVSSLHSLTYDSDYMAGSVLTAPQPYRLIVPANSVTFVWAFQDADADGILNETDDRAALAAVNVDGGRVVTGTRSQDGLDMGLMVPGSAP